MGFDGFPSKPGDIPALDIIADLRAALAAERERSEEYKRHVFNAINGANEQAKAVAKLREALGRFVANADRADSDDLADTDATYVVVAHLRHARAVLKEVGGVDE